MELVHKQISSSNFLVNDDGFFILKKEFIQKLNFKLEWQDDSNASSYAIAILNYSTAKLLGQASVVFLATNLKENSIDLNQVEQLNCVFGSNSSTTPSDKGIYVECMPKHLQASSIKDSQRIFIPQDLKDQEQIINVKVYGLKKDLNLTNGYFYGDLNEQLIDNVTSIKSFNFLVREK